MHKHKKEFENLDQYDYLNDEYIYKVEDKYAPLVGLFLFSFSSLEHKLNIAIAEIISNRSHDLGYQVIEKLLMGSKIDLFYKLYLQMVTVANLLKYKEKLLEIKNGLETSNKFRNIIAHANWSSLQKDGRVRVKIVVNNDDGYTKFQLETITPKMIREQIRQTEKITEKLYKFYDSVFQSL